MNENHDKDLQALREALAPLDERCPMPAKLNVECVMLRAEPPRRKPVFTLRRALAFAAALAVVLTSAFVSDKLNLFTSNTLRPLPDIKLTEEEVEPLSTYYELEQAFMRLQKNAQDNGNVWNGFIFAGFNEAEKRAAPAMGADGAMDLGGIVSTRPAAMTVEETAAPINGSSASASHGETNVQAIGVDEADILKNDGEYFYYVTGNRVYILQALPADKMKVLSKLSIPDYRTGTELYMQGDRMALVYSEYPPGGDGAASVQIYDISNRERPLLVKSFSQKGNLLSSRLQNGRIYLLSTQWANLDFAVYDGMIPEEDILPRVYSNGEEILLPAAKIAVLPDSDEPSYLVLSSLDLLSAKSESESVAVLGAGSQMYCSTEALYVACTQYARGGLMRGGLISSAPARWWGVEEKTLIYRFDLLADGKVKAGPQGEVAGSPLNQFSMDEYNGYFRIATTGFGENGDTVNILTVLNKNLKVAGCINNIAPGERIQSARFIGGKGYIVTFRQTDPLYVIDLSDPKKPTIEGELKLPGFSAYLHPWDATHLIGVGPDGDEQGTNGGTKISLFDISNPAAPREVDRVKIPDSWCDIQYNHKAFTVCQENGLFGLPITTNGNYRKMNSSCDFYTFKVQGNKLSQTHILKAMQPDARAALDSMNYYYGDEGAARRGTYIGGTWYVFGDRPSGIAAYSMDSGKQLGALAF